VAPIITPAVVRFPVSSTPISPECQIRVRSRESREPVANALAVRYGNGDGDQGLGGMTDTERVCPNCGAGMVRHRAERQWTSARQVEVRWCICPSCRHLSLSRWDWTGIIARGPRRASGRSDH
jgi:hypothetical protein